MLYTPVAIPPAKAGPSYAYRDARRGSLEGSELLAPWPEGPALPRVLEGDVLLLLNEKW